MGPRCPVRKKRDKFQAVGPTPICRRSEAPRIAECPIRIECRAVNTIGTGDHTIFVGEVAAKSGDPDAMKDGTAFKDFLLHHT